jgi:hypothetical protein
MRIDTILVRCRSRQEGLREAASRFCRQAGLPLRLERTAWSAETGWAYVYAALATGGPVEPGALAQLWTSLHPEATEVDVSRLQLVQDLAGYSDGAAPSHHYVVETDPEAAWDEQIARWYNEEHLPGLAAVPGCVRARRYVNLDAGPRSHACYGLVATTTLGSPAWLAVRGTLWSSQVRPHFTNTRRTMLAIVE